MEFQGIVMILQICFMVALPVGVFLDFIVKGNVNYFALGVAILVIWYVPKHNPLFQELVEKWKGK